MSNVYEHLRGYAWNYFEFHAKQRLTTFNYYLVISTLLSGGYMLSINGLPQLALLLSIVLLLLSFIFWKLDQRSRQLIKNSENALKRIEGLDGIPEEDDLPSILNIFRHEERQTKAIRDDSSRLSWNRLLTYTTCLNTVFISFAVMGMFGLVNATIMLTNG